MAFRNCNLNINQVLTLRFPTQTQISSRGVGSLALSPRETPGPVCSSSQSSERVGVRAEEGRGEKRNPQHLSHSVQLFVLRGPSPRLDREQRTGRGGGGVLTGAGWLWDTLLTSLCWISTGQRGSPRPHPGPYSLLGPRVTGDEVGRSPLNELTEDRKPFYQESLSRPVLCHDPPTLHKHTHTHNIWCQSHNSAVRMECGYPHFTADNIEAPSAGMTLPRGTPKAGCAKSVWFQNPNSYPSNYWQECTKDRSHLDPPLPTSLFLHMQYPLPRTSSLLYPSTAQPKACLFQEVLPEDWQLTPDAFTQLALWLFSFLSSF